MTETGRARSREDALDAFWAGVVEELRVSPARHRVVMTVWISEKTGKADRWVRAWYELAFVGVTRFDFADTNTASWWDVELTAITQPARSGRAEYWFTLSEHIDALHIVCEDVQVRLIDRDEDE